MSDHDVLGPDTMHRIGTYQHFRWLKGIIIAVLALNTLDAGLTLYVVLNGLATEANPFMETLIDRPILFVVVKTALVVFGCRLLWGLKKRPLAVMAIFFAFLVYYGVLLFHLHHLDLRMIQRIFG